MVCVAELWKPLCALFQAKREREREREERFGRGEVEGRGREALFPK